MGWAESSLDMINALCYPWSGRDSDPIGAPLIQTTALYLAGSNYPTVTGWRD